MLQDLKEIDVQNANVTLWVFKKSLNAKTKAPVFTGRWVDTTEQLNARLIQIFEIQRENITETKDYSLVALTNENSALTIAAEETLSNLVVAGCDSETDARKATKVAQLDNAFFYVIKIRVGEDVAYAVRKTENSWKTKNSKSIVTAIWKDDELELVDDNSFRISNIVDFIIFNDLIYIRNKLNFESVLNFKEAHVSQFTNIMAEVDFNKVFTDSAIIASYVGDNKTHLRRAMTIHQLGYYKDADFMKSLYNNMSKLKYNFSMNSSHIIDANLETCPEIFKALLDHRLLSHTNAVFEVEDASAVV